MFNKCVESEGKYFLRAVVPELEHASESPGGRGGQNTGPHLWNELVGLQRVGEFAVL